MVEVKFWVLASPILRCCLCSSLSEPPKSSTSLVQKKELSPKAGFEPAGKAEIGTTRSQWAVGVVGQQAQAKRGEGCGHLTRQRRHFRSPSRAGRYRLWAQQETLRDLRPSITSSHFSCPPLPRERRPRTRWGLLGQDPGPRIQCQDLALSPTPLPGLPTLTEATIATVWQTCAFGHTPCSK